MDVGLAADLLAVPVRGHPLQTLLVSDTLGCDDSELTGEMCTDRDS